MLTFPSLVSTVALFAALLIPGFIMGKCKRVQRSAVSTVANILSDVAMPALVLVKLLEIDIKTLDPTSIVICLALPSVVIMALHFISKLAFASKHEDRSDSAAKFCSVFSNCGFLGIPLAAALFPDRPEATVYVSLANLVSSFFLLTLGMNILSDGCNCKKNGIVCIIFRPITFAVIIGFVLSAFDVGSMLPSLTSYFGTLSSLTTPLSMIVLGYELSQMKPKELFGDARIYAVGAIKLLVSPMIAFVLLAFLKFILKTELSYTLKAAMLITTAISTAASAPAMARANGIEGSLPASATIVNTLLCVITLPTLWALFDAVLI